VDLFQGRAHRKKPVPDPLPPPYPRCPILLLEIPNLHVSFSRENGKIKLQKCFPSINAIRRKVKKLGIGSKVLPSEKDAMFFA